MTEEHDATRDEFVSLDRPESNNFLGPQPRDAGGVAARGSVRPVPRALHEAIDFQRKSTAVTAVTLSDSAGAEEVEVPLRQP